MNTSCGCPTAGRAAARTPSWSDVVLLQEREGPGVEALDVLVDRCVRAPVEDDELGVWDTRRDGAREPGRGALVVLAEGDQGRRRDPVEHAGRVVRQDGVRLP